VFEIKLFQVFIFYISLNIKPVLKAAWLKLSLVSSFSDTLGTNNPPSLVSPRLVAWIRSGEVTLYLIMVSVGVSSASKRFSH